MKSPILIVELLWITLFLIRRRNLRQDFPLCILIDNISTISANRLIVILIWRPIYRQPVYVGIYLPLAPAHSNYRLETKININNLLNLFCVIKVIEINIWIYYYSHNSLMCWFRHHMWRGLNGTVVVWRILRSPSVIKLSY